MHVYAAAVYSNGYMRGQARYEKLTEHEQQIVRTMNEQGNVLESYHYVGKQKHVDQMRAENARIFLDSGAFSAWTLGTHISIVEYCDYIKRNLDILRVEDGAVMASVLDGIGDPLQTYRNQLEMEARGAKPLPCFHMGEDEKYLDYYVANYSYITIGGMVGSSTDKLTTFLDRIWSKHLVDGSGRAKVKVHGFGVTSIPLMENYPWYSCDSSSWIQAAAFGSVMTPKWGPLPVSDKSPSRHDKGRHISTLTQAEQDVVFKYLEDNGFTYERLSTIYESRAAFNLWSYMVVNASINAAKSDTFKTIVQELF